MQQDQALAMLRANLQELELAYHQQPMPETLAGIFQLQVAIQQLENQQNQSQ